MFVPFAVLVPVPVPVDAVPVLVPAPVPVPVPGADVCEPAGAVVVPLPDATMVAEPVCELASTVEFAPTRLEEKVAFAGTTYAKRFRELFTVGRLRRGTLGG